MIRWLIICFGLGLILFIIGLMGLIVIPAVILSLGLIAGIIAGILTFIFVCVALAVLFCI